MYRVRDTSADLPEVTVSLALDLQLLNAGGPYPRNPGPYPTPRNEMLSTNLGCLKRETAEASISPGGALQFQITAGKPRFYVTWPWF